MPEFPPITIIVLTYQRLGEIQQCLAALREHLQYPADRLNYLIADDSSPNHYEARLRKTPIFKALDARYTSTPVNSGFGANYNHALAECTTDFHFFIESDYILHRDLDLRAAAALMIERPMIGMLRFRGIAATHVVAHLFEADIKDYCPEYREGVGLMGKLSYWQFDSGSPTLWLWSNGCHLKRRSFTEFYGRMPERGKLGAIEEKYSHIVKDKMKERGAPAIAIQPEWVAMHFDHIAPTYQLTDFDIERT